MSDTDPQRPDDNELNVEGTFRGSPFRMSGNGYAVLAAIAIIGLIFISVRLIGVTQSAIDRSPPPPAIEAQP